MPRRNSFQRASLLLVAYIFSGGSVGATSVHALTDCEAACARARDVFEPCMRACARDCDCGTRERACVDSCSGAESYALRWRTERARSAKSFPTLSSDRPPDGGAILHTARWGDKKRRYRGPRKPGSEVVRRRCRAESKAVLNCIGVCSSRKTRKVEELLRDCKESAAEDEIEEAWTRLKPGMTTDAVRALLSSNGRTLRIAETALCGGPNGVLIWNMGAGLWRDKSLEFRDDKLVGWKNAWQHCGE
jgi:hypothetical protein